MDSKTLIKKFYTFFEDYKKNEIKKALYEGADALILDFMEISEFNLDLADYILTFPKDAISLMEETLKQFYEDESSKKIRVRF